MTSKEIRKWFTPERLEQLDLQKMEDLAGIDRTSIAYGIHFSFSYSECKALTPLLKIIEEGFNDCNK